MIRALVATGTALVTATLGLCVAGETGAAHAATAVPVSVTETTADQSQLLASQAGTSFQAGGSSAAETITVNPSTTYQSMTGFGASFTDSAANVVYNSPSRDAIMTKLFDPTNGIGLDFLRQPVGASDFSLSSYTYDDMPSGQTDPNLSNFSITHDNAYIIPILQEALKDNPATTVMATPWSPPAWMKNNDALDGGTFNTADYAAYAQYLVRFIQAYQADGIPISLLSAQNEPEYSPSDYPGMTLTADQEATFIGSYLGPALRAAGLSTGILAYDHNWNDTSYPESVLGDSTAAPYITGVAWHCYSGDPSAQNTVHSAYPNVGTYFTECSPTTSDTPADTFADTLDWETENLFIDATRDWAKTVTTWNMALNQNNGPSMNCTTCQGLVTVNSSDNSVTYNAPYYATGQVSKFVKPGAVRIDSNTFGSGNVEDVAFQNPDGSTALEVLNSNTSSSETFGVSENGQSFTYTLPAKAVATFTWPTAPSGTGGGGITSGAWYQVVNANSGKCVDDTNGATANGTAVQQWTCTSGDSNQDWEFTPTSGGYYEATTRNAPTVGWDVTGGASATADGTPIQLWSYGGGTNQQWEPVSLGGGQYEFVARNSGSCLDVTNRSTSDGTQLQQWSCTAGDSAQIFTLAQQT